MPLLKAATIITAALAAAVAVPGMASAHQTDRTVSSAGAMTPMAVNYAWGVRTVHTRDRQCTGRLDANRTGPGRWYVRATFHTTSRQGCSYYLWRRHGGAWGALSHSDLKRNQTHRTAWYWDGTGYAVMMTVNDADGWGDARSKPF